MDPRDFVKHLSAPLRSADPTLASLPRCIVIAHAAFESGWGGTKIAKEGHNYFSITRLRSSDAPIIESGDKEYKPDGTVIQISQPFAKYASAEEALVDYFKFIKKLRYQPAYSHLMAGNLVAFITTLRKGGYFTLPLDQYLAAMSSVLGRVANIALEEV